MGGAQQALSPSFRHDSSSRGTKLAISHLADVSPRAVLGEGVSIGAFTVVHDNVKIGDNTSIDSHCAIGVPTPGANGMPLAIGTGSIIRSHNVLYEGSTFGSNLRTGHHVSLRENLVVGENLQLGTFVDLQGNAHIGHYVRIYSGSHIAEGTTIGNYVWIFPYVVFTNDPHPPSDGFHVGAKVEDFAVIATGATVLPGVTIGKDSLVGAASLVSKDVSANTFVSGIPAKKVALARHVLLRDGSGPAYPWRRHFHRGMPDDAVRDWIAEFSTDATR